MTIKRSPSIDMMVKRLHLKKTDATYLKKIMKSGNVDRAMDVANILLNGYGVESIQHEALWTNHYFQNIGLLYVNKGDTYNVTLCYDTEKETVFVGSWGDWYESHKEIRKYDQKNW